MQKYRWCQIVQGKCRDRVLLPETWAGTLGQTVHGKVQGPPCLRAGDNVCRCSAAQGFSALPRQWELSRGAVQLWCLCMVVFHAAGQALDCSLSPGWWNEEKAVWFGFYFFLSYTNTMWGPFFELLKGCLCWECFDVFLQQGNTFF